MPDDTDLTLDEVLATRTTGLPARVVASRAAYERLALPHAPPASSTRVSFTVTGDPKWVEEIRSWVNGPGTGGDRVSRTPVMRKNATRLLNAG